MPRNALTGILAALLVAGIALVAWQLAYVLLLAFAGLLVAVFLRRTAALLARHSPLSVGAALAVVVLGLVAALALLIVFVGPQILDQLERLWQSLPRALGRVEQTLQQREWGRFLLERVSNEEGGPRWNVLGAIGGTVSTVLGLAGNLIILVSVAIFLAIDPSLYRQGLIRLVPMDRRARAGEILDTIGDGLWWWLLGQFVAMAVVAVLTGAGLWLIGIPLALALGLIAGLVNFIPYLGPFISAVPAVLIAFAQSPSAALYTVLLFVIVQQIEGNVLMPVVQERATSLPPVLTILAVIGFGVLFGFIGVLVATPLLLVLIVLVRMIYVEDVLGDRERTT